MTFMRKPGSSCAKLIGAQPMGSRMLPIKAPYCPGLDRCRVGDRLCLWTLGKCSLPLWTTHICDLQRGARRRRWNICFPSSLPSWSSTASVCWKFPPRVRGLTPHPLDLSSVEDWDIYPAGSFSKELSFLFPPILTSTLLFSGVALVSNQSEGHSETPQPFTQRLSPKILGWNSPCPRSVLNVWWWNWRVWSLCTLG